MLHISQLKDTFNMQPESVIVYRVIYTETSIDNKTRLAGELTMPFHKQELSLLQGFYFFDK